MKSIAQIGFEKYRLSGDCLWEDLADYEKNRWQKVAQAMIQAMAKHDTPFQAMDNTLEKPGDSYELGGFECRRIT